jgi:hypothetical protein
LRESPSLPPQLELSLDLEAQESLTRSLQKVGITLASSLRFSVQSPKSAKGQSPLHSSGTSELQNMFKRPPDSYEPTIDQNELESTVHNIFEIARENVTKELSPGKVTLKSMRLKNSNNSLPKITTSFPSKMAEDNTKLEVDMQGGAKVIHDIAQLQDRLESPSFTGFMKLQESEEDVGGTVDDLFVQARKILTQEKSTRDSPDSLHAHKAHDVPAQTLSDIQPTASTPLSTEKEHSNMENNNTHKLTETKSESDQRPISNSRQETLALLANHMSIIKKVNFSLPEIVGNARAMPIIEQMVLSRPKSDDDIHKRLNEGNDESIKYASQDLISSASSCMTDVGTAQNIQRLLRRSSFNRSTGESTSTENSTTGTFKGHKLQDHQADVEDDEDVTGTIQNLTLTTFEKSNHQSHSEQSLEDRQDTIENVTLATDSTPKASLLNIGIDNNPKQPVPLRTTAMFRDLLDQKGSKTSRLERRKSESEPVVKENEGEKNSLDAAEIDSDSNTFSSRHITSTSDLASELESDEGESMSASFEWHIQEEQADPQTNYWLLEKVASAKESRSYTIGSENASVTSRSSGKVRLAILPQNVEECFDKKDPPEKTLTPTSILRKSHIDFSFNEIEEAPSDSETPRGSKQKLCLFPVYEDSVGDITPSQSCSALASPSMHKMALNEENPRMEDPLQLKLDCLPNLHEHVHAAYSYQGTLENKNNGENIGMYISCTCVPRIPLLDQCAREDIQWSTPK